MARHSTANEKQNGRASVARQRGNANCRPRPLGLCEFTWPQKLSGFIHHLAPTGMAGFVLANGSMSSNSSGEGDLAN